MRKREILDKILYKKYIKNRNKIYHLIDRYEYISFDIYDTLVKRLVPDPTDVFELVERKYNDNAENDTKLINFKEIRQKAQLCAKQKSNTEEITLHDIYNEIEEFVSDQKMLLENIEKNIEEDIAVFNYAIKDIWEYCIRQRKQIICISDMYLEKETICSVLNHCGIKGYEKLYVSSDKGLKKSTGSLYDFVLKDLGIKSSEILHIGDNVKGDFLCARKKRIKTILWPRNIKQTHYWRTSSNDSIQKKVCYSFVSNGITKIENDAERLGYEVLGILLYGMCAWLKRETANCDRLFFLARDAHLLMSTYEMLYPEDKERISYLYISRRSVQRAYLSSCHKSNELWEMHAHRKISYKGVFDDAGLPKEKSKINLDEMICKSKFNSEPYKGDIENLLQINRENFSQNRKLFLEYMIQEHVMGKIGFVDLVVMGTIPYYVEKIFDEESIPLDLYNYLFGFIVNGSRTLKNNVVSYMKKYSFKKEEFAQGLFEMFFLEPVGSTVGYKTNGKGIIIPVKEKNENEDSFDIIVSIQDGALTFIKEGANFFLEWIDDLGSDIALEPFLRFSQMPRKRDLRIFKKMKYFSNKLYGTTRKHIRIYYFLHPKALVNEFINSIWRVGFLKDFFIVPLPWQKIYNRLKRIMRAIYSK